MNIELLQANGRDVTKPIYSHTIVFLLLQKLNVKQFLKNVENKIFITSFHTIQ